MRQIIIIGTILFMCLTSSFSSAHGSNDAQKNIQIIEVHYISADEYVLFKNNGEETVNMEGMVLVSSSMGQIYQFEKLFLEPGETFRLHSGPKASGLCWTYDYVHNDTTDGVLLTDKNGEYVSAYRWGR